MHGRKRKRSSSHELDDASARSSSAHFTDDEDEEQRNADQTRWGKSRPKQVPLYWKDPKKHRIPWLKLYPVKEKRKWRLEHEIAREPRPQNDDSDLSEQNSEYEILSGRTVHDEKEDAADADSLLPNVGSMDDVITIGEDESDGNSQDNQSNIDKIETDESDSSDGDDDSDASICGQDLDLALPARYAKIAALTVDRSLAGQISALIEWQSHFRPGCIAECFHWNPLVEILTSETDTTKDDPDAPITIYPVDRPTQYHSFSVQGKNGLWTSATSPKQQFLRHIPGMCKGVRRLLGVLKIPKQVYFHSKVLYWVIHDGYTGKGLAVRSVSFDEDGYLVDSSKRSI